MLLLLIVVSSAVLCSEAKGPFRRQFPDFEALSSFKNESGNPLFLTPYIERGNITLARTLAKVSETQASMVPGYSGYFTVNEPCDSNLFFWFFPAQHKPSTAPVLLWLQGGPGGSSLFGLFVEHGPFAVDENLNLTLRNTAWTLTHNVLYIDNPVGTGYSFTRKDKCYAKDQTDVAHDLYSALIQFFKLFPKLQKNDFFVTGESYAGKYVPAITYKIHKANPSAKIKINLKGMAIGDGLCDPATMTDYGEFLFSIGLLDEGDRKYFEMIAAKEKQLIKAGKYVEAFKLFDDLLNGDLSGHPSVFQNRTGFSYYFNYLMTEAPADFSFYPMFIQLPGIRKAIHVGNLTYNDGSIVEKHLIQDVMKSVKPWIEELLDAGYHVMIYNGQLDVIIAWPLSESFISSMKWKGEKEYKSKQRTIWHAGSEIAGYAKQVGNFTQVFVRNAGHMVPYDQPKWAFDLMNRFTRGKAFD